MNSYGAVLFFGTQAALRAEKILVQDGRVVKLIPTPRSLSSDCGIALRFYWPERDQVRASLQAASLEFDAIAVMD